MTNCPNCGAPLEILNSKCSYCGTPYFDISTMEIGGEPFILKLKYKNSLIVAQARLMDFEIRQEPIFVEAVDFTGCNIKRCIRDFDSDINLHLKAFAIKGD